MVEFLGEVFKIIFELILQIIIYIIIELIAHLIVVPDAPNSASRNEASKPVNVSPLVMKKVYSTGWVWSARCWRPKHCSRKRALRGGLINPARRHAWRFRPLIFA